MFASEVSVGIEPIPAFGKGSLNSFGAGMPMPPASTMLDGFSIKVESSKASSPTKFLVSVVSISIGALVLYSIANFFFNDLVKNILEKKFLRYVQIFQKNEFFYFFIYRFVGGLGIPFFLQNVFPVLFNMKKINYFFSSFLGFIPVFFIFNTIGAGLNLYIDQTDKFSFLELLFTPAIYYPILMFVSLAILSFVIKKIFFSNVN